MNRAKVLFSPAETELLNNANIILTKNAALQKIKDLLEEVQRKVLAVTVMDNAVMLPRPKISRGENYLGLPYLVLDFPRHFDSDNILLLRSMFWWGHSFSSTLHLSGTQKTLHLPGIINGYVQLAASSYHIGINADPWQHHFGEDNYVRVDSLTRQAFEACCRRYDHLKISAMWQLENVEAREEDLVQSWTVLMRLLGLIAA